MVEQGQELDGAIKDNFISKNVFRWSSEMATFQIKSRNGWDVVPISEILSRRFRIREKREPRQWYGRATTKFYGIRFSEEKVIDGPPEDINVCYVLTEIL
jgi:hypothetical protein